MIIFILIKEFYFFLNIFLYYFKRWNDIGEDGARTINKDFLKLTNLTSLDFDLR